MKLQEKVKNTKALNEKRQRRKKTKCTLKPNLLRNVRTNKNQSK